MLRRVHHIDFVVRDLDAAAERYSRIFGIEPLGRERLDDRGVELVRFELDNVWLVLVQPVGDGPVSSFLEEHGEGFFHAGFQVDDVTAEAERIEGEGIRLVNRVPRRGVEGWLLVDLEMDETFGVYLQLVQDDAE
ncbi:MAG: VOC family protein [Thermoanaerobaculia bacterium]